jgi:hypothetical protein
VAVAWGASDAYSGIGRYSVRYDMWSARGPVQTDVEWVPLGTATGAGFGAVPGRTYCVEVLAQDRAGNSALQWSARRCFAAPLDDAAFDRRPGSWKRQTDLDGYYLDDYLQTRERGAWLRQEVVGRRLALLATTCPRCGSVAVLWRGRVVRRVDLSAATTTKSKLIPLVRFARRQRGTVRIEVTSTGRRVRIDGLGVSAV